MLKITQLQLLVPNLNLSFSAAGTGATTGQQTTTDGEPDGGGADEPPGRQPERCAEA